MGQLTEVKMKKKLDKERRIKLKLKNVCVCGLYIPATIPHTIGLTHYHRIITCSCDRRWNFDYTRGVITWKLIS